MASTYVLYNPHSGNGEEDAKILEVVLSEPVLFFDITRITNYTAFLRGMDPSDRLILTGGDGTLHRFVNDTAGIRIPQEILWFPIGSRCSLAHKLGQQPFCEPFPVSQYLSRLPSVELDGKVESFLSSIDLCDSRDRPKNNGGPHKYLGQNCYPPAALRHFLWHFKPRSATVIVDGQAHFYKKVWIASTTQEAGSDDASLNQEDPKQALSILVLHGIGRLRAMFRLPCILKRNQTGASTSPMAAIHTGHEIIVKFDRPTPLQVDGEPTRSVISYTARSAAAKGTQTLSETQQSSLRAAEQPQSRNEVISMQNSTPPLLYRIIKRLVRAFYLNYEVVGTENLPDEPVIVVGNHAQMHGPLACELYFPGHRYTWCAGQMMHLKDVPAYAYSDFWSQKPAYTRWFYKLLSYLIAPLAAYIFNHANTIGVYRDSRILSTFKETVKRLSEGASVVIFPEHDATYNNIIYKFQDKFIDIAKLYCRRTKKELAFVPLYIAPDLHKMYLGKPVRFCSSAPLEEERTRIRRYLMDEITQIARGLPEHTVVPYRNIPKKQYPSNLSEEALHEKADG